MKNYKMDISYDGSRYFGWERKEGRPTVQGKLEDVLAEMTGGEVKVIGAGRTDAGVHARGMTANAHMETELTPRQIQNYMNHYLPEDISVDSLEEASDRFHARYNARGKEYCYACYVGGGKPVFDRKQLLTLDFEPDLEAMRKAAEKITGTRDYRAFCTNAGGKKSTVRTVDTIEITLRKNRLVMRFHGNGFLQNMVRIMAGTLLEVGKGNLRPEDMEAILASGVRKNAGPTAPAKGLTLMKVEY